MSKLDKLHTDLMRHFDPGKTVQDLRQAMSRVQEVLDQLDASATTTGMSMVQTTAPVYTCPRCGNKDQAFFVSDNHSGDTICMGKNAEGCGEVVQDHKIHEGQQYRMLEDKDDPDHHGPAPDPFMPIAHNMATKLVSQSLGGDSLSRKLARTAKDVEMGLSNIGTDDRRTREGYKSGMKREATLLMERASPTLGIPGVWLDEARRIFGIYRDVKEHVIAFETTVAACLAIAYENLKDKVDIENIAAKGVMPDTGETARIMADIERSTKSTPHIVVNTNAFPKHSQIHASVPIGEWTLTMVREWLESIEGLSPNTIRVVLAYLQEAAQQHDVALVPSKKPLQKLVGFKRPHTSYRLDGPKRIKQENGLQHAASPNSSSSASPNLNLNSGLKRSKPTSIGRMLVVGLDWGKATRYDSNAMKLIMQALTHRRHRESVVSAVEEQNRLRTLTRENPNIDKPWLLNVTSQPHAHTIQSGKNDARGEVNTDSNQGTRPSTPNPLPKLPSLETLNPHSQIKLSSGPESEDVLSPPMEDDDLIWLDEDH